MLNSADVVVLCLPDDAARESVALIENPSVRVLDASTAHRTAKGWVYGLPELSTAQSEAIAAAPGSPIPVAMPPAPFWRWHRSEPRAFWLPTLR